MNERGSIFKQINDTIGKKQILLPPDPKKGIDVPYFRTEIGGTPKEVAIATGFTVGLCLISLCLIIGLPLIISR